MSARVLALCLGYAKGQPKQMVTTLELRPDCGILGDIHAGLHDRQVSLLAEEDVERVRTPDLPLSPGAFGENLRTQGLALEDLPLGTRLRVGLEVVLRLCVRGKECHTHCAIQERLGQCLMPVRGLFARVEQGGTIHTGDALQVLEILAHNPAR